jgi:hypothetical protein
LKKPAGSVRFRFYNQKTEKTEPNRNRKKNEQNRKNRARTEKTEPKPEKTKPKPRKPSQTGFCPKKPNRIETGRFDPVSVRFRFFFQKKNISVWLLFLIKTEPNRK